MSLPIEEQWRPIPGYEGRYEASSLGRIRSHLSGSPRLMKSYPSRGGYLTLRLRSPITGCRTEAVHRLVVMAFHGTHDLSLHTRHLDGNQLNNRADNLAWGTRSENMQDAVRHGTHSRAGATHCINGHEYTPENTAQWRDRRTCRACRAATYARNAKTRRKTA